MNSPSNGFKNESDDLATSDSISNNSVSTEPKKGPFLGSEIEESKGLDEGLAN